MGEVRVRLLGWVVWTMGQRMSERRRGESRMARREAERERAEQHRQPDSSSQPRERTDRTAQEGHDRNNSARISRMSTDSLKGGRMPAAVPARRKRRTVRGRARGVRDCRSPSEQEGQGSTTVSDSERRRMDGCQPMLLWRTARIANLYSWSPPDPQSVRESARVCPLFSSFSGLLTQS